MIVPPLYPRANKSVVASLLERQPTLIPRYNYALPEPLRNLGVVWGDGQKFSTGESGNSVPDIDAQWDAGRRLVDPKGPAQTDFFRLLTGAQGTLGIVTWASVRVQLLPDPKKTLFVTADKLDDLVDLSYRLTRLRVGDELLILNGTYLAALLAADGAEAAALREALPAWTLVIGIGGRALRADQRVAVAEQDIAAEVAARGLRLQTALPGVATSRIEAVLAGFAGEPHWKLRQRRRGRHLLPHHAGEGPGSSWLPCRTPRWLTSTRWPTWASTCSRNIRAWPITWSSACRMRRRTRPTRPRPAPSTATRAPG